jgi:peptidyl-tRNA hydrolase, PTH1 family
VPSAPQDAPASGPDPDASPEGRGPGLLARLFRRRPAAPVPRPRRLIVGLGNPGPDYAETRHNVGFLVADAAARQSRGTFAPERGPYVAAHGTWRGTPFAVAKPAGLYMNQSGAAVKKLLAAYGLTPADCLVAYDDLGLEPGQIRLRAEGSAGGHNGVQNIIDVLGTASFPRLRIGIGASFPRGGQVDYVLGPFGEEERPAVEAAVDRAAEAALAFVAEGLSAAMNEYNRRPLGAGPA